MINYFKALCVLSVIFLFSGCCFLGAYNDMTNNKYLIKKPVSNLDDALIGEWTASTPASLMCIKINPDGTGKYCQNKTNGIVEKGYLKIYRDANNTLFLIVECGVQLRIDEFSEKCIKARAYGFTWNFVPGIHSLNCKKFLKGE